MPTVTDATYYCISCASTPTRMRPSEESSKLDTRELNQFLAGCEARAFRTVFYAIKHEEDALDIVQDTMMKFASGYATKPAAEWPLLFQRILQNGIKDFFRRQKVRNRWTVLLDQLRPAHYRDDPEQIDPLETVADQRKLDGESQLASERSLSRVEQALAALPLRQQQAFLLRSWEGLNTKETATAMGCSEGSVKTHYFRALEQLRKSLEDH